MCSCGDYWGSESRLDRLDRCRRFLFGEGMTTPAENHEIEYRLTKARLRKHPPKPLEVKKAANG
jgi:hypothetical protein